MTAKTIVSVPVRDVERLARVFADVDMRLRSLGKRQWRLHPSGVWRGWRAGTPERDELIGDYVFRYLDADGFMAQQTISHEFVNAYPAYLPDGDHPADVEEWWLDWVLAERARRELANQD